MLLTLLHSFFTRVSKLAIIKLNKNYPSLNIYVSDPEIKLYKNFTSSVVDISKNRAKIINSSPYMRVEID